MTRITPAEDGLPPRITAGRDRWPALLAREATRLAWLGGLGLLALTLPRSVPAAPAAAPAVTAPPRVVINEIHFDPPEKKPLEFVELHNASGARVDLSGWALDRFAFPTNTLLAPGGFAVIARDPAAFAREYGFQPLGPLPGKLSGKGERLSLLDAVGREVDEVRYGVGYPWPTAAKGAGSSLERVHPELPSNEPGSWRSSGYPALPPASTGTVFVPASDPSWRWRKGTNEASRPAAGWRQPGFLTDGSWLDGRTSIGFGDDDDNTLVTDMQGGYTSLFLRHTFVVGPTLPSALLLRVRVDDGCVAWINGVEVARLHVRAGELPFNAVALNHEAGEEFEEVELANPAPFLTVGTNVLAIQVFNASRTSSDLTLDAELRTSDGISRRRRPTPGATNSVFSAAQPPLLGDVTHAPLQPKSGEAVTVTARVTAATGLREVRLQYQIVEPGRYLRKGDPAYQTNWTSIALRDDGLDGDTRAGDGIFTALLPGTLQQHRRLIRYRVIATDTAGRRVQVPYADDGSPNFAWFVHDGIPAWTGASRPGHTRDIQFTVPFLATIQAYHLLARSEDVARSQWDSGANRVRFQGTLVQDGRVYDHIQFHNRGTGSAYISGKNKWGLKFNRARELAARDNQGRPYAHPWDSLNLNPGLSTPYLPVHCGIAGLDEAVAFRAFQLAGVPSANTHWIQLRVIDNASESSPADQYVGDQHGLYLAIQDMDGALLKELGLPDGNLYSMQSGRKHLARGAPSDRSDWNQFLDGVRAEQPEAWWRTNLDLPAYYSFQSLCRVIGNVDLRPDGNHGYYRRPEGRWAPFPWDHDMMFVPRVHQPGHIDAIRSLNVPALRREFQGRAREILDLFCADPSPDGGQVGQLVDELSRVLMPAGFTHNWGQLDEAVWNWNPHQNQPGNFYRNPAEGNHFGGSWRRTLATPDLAGFCRYLVEFCTDSRPIKNYAPNDGDQRGYGFGFLQQEAADGVIPAAPQARYTGRAGFPVAELPFATTPFAPLSGTNRFAAVQWRVGEISAPGRPGFVPGRPRKYELEPFWTSSEIATNASPLQLPDGLCRSNHTYRVRARYKDQTGRWGHWSPPVQFVAGP